jgi:hypothetical protein
LLEPAKKHGPQRRIAPYQQSPDSSRTMKLMRGNAQRIDPQRTKVDRQLPRHLHRIGMDFYIPVAG